MAMTTIGGMRETLTAGLWIGGERRTAGSGGTYEHVNPSTGQVQGLVPLAGASEVDEAVEAARSAFHEWRRWDPADRRRILNKLAALLADHADELLTIESLETGIPVSTGGMLPLLLGGLEYAASLADKLAGTVVPTKPGAVFDYTLVEPIGVVGVIIPWNGPVGQIGLSVSSPLAAGCTVILKPSELAPFSSDVFGRLCIEAGIPAGVVNVLPGTAEAGEALVRHPGVDKISFVGSVGTSRKVAAGCAATGKSALLELGGKSADLVFADTDVRKAAGDAIGWLVYNAGQACTLASRFIVHDSIYDDYVELVVQGLDALQVGDASDPRTDMGPVINKSAQDRVLSMIERAKHDSSVRLLTGGGRIESPGFHVQPTLFEASNSAEISREEVFGPVLSVMRFHEDDEAIAIANDSSFGLAGYVHTSDLSRALRVAAELDTGNIGINGGMAPGVTGAPFGGVKDSGYGRAGGIAGVTEFTRLKNVMISL
ncbi:Aldehyde dehydrogenase [Rhodococcus wratislaviensis]|uniref:Aldehyde dehydrogenase n=2 Tax=Nocardiaceae TaxID=85025 RepID=A0A402CMC3_RHOWR|nr:Aldehyde dehydrogenase [Rhodococcus wratislaviensis]